MVKEENRAKNLFREAKKILTPKRKYSKLPPYPLIKEENYKVGLTKLKEIVKNIQMMSTVLKP
jgi:hypothetical protein